MNESETRVLTLWAELCQNVMELQPDFEKNVLKNNISAGVRSRKGLRIIRAMAAEIIKELQITDKAIRRERKEKNSNKP